MRMDLPHFTPSQHHENSKWFVAKKTKDVMRGYGQGWQAVENFASISCGWRARRLHRQPDD
jgi:hypothetical protein